MVKLLKKVLKWYLNKSSEIYWTPSGMMPTIKKD